MTTGWVDIVIDGKPAQVRICYVRAWNDPAWRKANRLPERSPQSRGGPKPEPKP